MVSGCEFNFMQTQSNNDDLADVTPNDESGSFTLNSEEPFFQPLLIELAPNTLY